MVCTEQVRSSSSYLYLLEEVPENRHGFFAIFLFHNVLQVLHCDLLSATPNLRAVNHIFGGQVGQEGHWVPIYDFGHRVGAYAFILADKSIYSWQGLVKTLVMKMIQNSRIETLLHTGRDAERLYGAYPPFLAYLVAGFCYNLNTSLL